MSLQPGPHTTTRELIDEAFQAADPATRAAYDARMQAWAAQYPQALNPDFPERAARSYLAQVRDCLGLSPEDHFALSQQLVFEDLVQELGEAKARVVLGW